MSCPRRRPGGWSRHCPRASWSRCPGSGTRRRWSSRRRWPPWSGSWLRYDDASTTRAVGAETAELYAVMTAKIERRFAVVLCADVVGYSRLMGMDEEGTLAALNATWREVVD